MKQSFTLKAVALGLAAVATFGVSAARPQLTQVKALDANGAAPFAIAKSSAKAEVQKSKVVTEFSTTARKLIRPAIEKLDLTAPAASRAIDPYGAWEDAGTLEYTFTQLAKNGLISEEAKVKSYPYQKRVHKQNPQQFQIKVAGWGAFTSTETGGAGEMPGSELILTVSPAQTTSGKVVGVVTTSTEGIALGWSINFGSAAAPKEVEMYYYDAYTWISNAAKVDPQITSAIVNEYYGTSTYNYGSGSFELFPSYGGQSGTESILDSLEWGDFVQGQGYTGYWLDSIQLSGKFYDYDAEVDADAGYFYRNAGESFGYFKAPFEINDNAVGVVKIINKKLATQDELNAEFNAMLEALNAPTEDMAVLTTADGWFNLKVSPYSDGEYTLIFGWSDGVETQNGLSFSGVPYSVVLEGSEFVLDGFAKYTDAFISGYVGLFGKTPAQLGLPAEYSTTCQVEKSETEAGVYRLRAPYAEYPLNRSLDYAQSLDYLYYNVSDPAKATVEPSMLGVWTDVTMAQGQDPHILMMGCCSYSLASGAEVNDGNGVFADNKLTFPGQNYKVTVEGKEKEVGPLANLFFDLTDSSALYITTPTPGDFLIETGAVDAIENVEAEAAADVNAPVEYYNLQGQKVLNPAAGQLVIKKQGGKVTKTIAQ